MKTYEVTLVTEMMATFKVRAKTAEEANEMAQQRNRHLCKQLTHVGPRHQRVFGDAVWHIMATDDA